MASLYLMRHGQASFGADDYDQLSAIGHQQAEVVGQHFADVQPINRVFSGSLVRHKQTFTAFASTYGSDLTVREIPGLNEFDHEHILEVYKPDWADKNTMRAELQASDHPRRAFQQVFEAAIKAWLDDAFDYQESWHAFKTRVLAALDQIQNETDSGSANLVVTSGGPISVMCQAVLGLDDVTAFALNKSLTNASITHLLYNQSITSLSYFNNFTALQCHDAKLVTYR